MTLAEHYGVPAGQLDAIAAACDEPGPFIYAVYEWRILRLPL